MLDTKNIISKPESILLDRNPGKFSGFTLGSYILPQQRAVSFLRPFLKKLIAEVQQSSLDLNAGQIFGNLFLKLLFEANKYGLGTVLLSCLISELQKQSSTRLEFRRLSEFCPLQNLFLDSTNTYANFGVNLFIPSLAISEPTHTHTMYPEDGL